MPGRQPRHRGPPPGGRSRWLCYVALLTLAFALSSRDDTDGLPTGVITVQSARNSGFRSGVAAASALVTSAVPARKPYTGVAGC